jgi:hypothetical protein
MSPRSAIPQETLDRDWKNTDNDSWWQRIKKHWIQYPLAAGPLVPSGFWRWREYPKLLYIKKGEGDLRFESSDGNLSGIDPIERGGKFYLRSNKPDRTLEEVYLSRIQPWCQWHRSLQWPLFFNCHYIYRKKNVVTYPEYKSDFGIGKMFTFGIGYKRDAGPTYWPTANGFGNFE